MNPELSQVSMGCLPRSVKVRSTCNACQQAKIRCSHEKPSCRRCLKQNLVCIYSVSRRLGRPAKKRDPPRDNDSRCQDDVGSTRQPHNKKGRSPKKKIKEDSVQETSHGSSICLDNVDRILLDQVAFENTMMEEFPPDAMLQSSGFLGGEKDSPFSVPDSFDLSSDSWLQDFMSSQPSELPQDRNILDVHGHIDPLVGATEMPGYIAALRCGPSAAQDEMPPSTHYYNHANSLPNVNESTLDNTLPYSESIKRDILAFTQHMPPSLDRFANNSPILENTCITTSRNMTRVNLDYITSADTGKTNANILSQPPPRQSQCQCHEQTVKELIRVNICGCRTGPMVTIDSILSSQRLLQQLADTILQCGMCSKSGVNLLMVVVVSIDSLVTALEAIVSVENGLMEGLFSDFQETHAYSFCRDVSTTTPNTRRPKGGGFQFKSQVESCPLLVGSFCVPADDKFSFVLQVLHSRLSGLLSTVRRIRLCAQDVLDIPASRGKLVMVTETDRRLQLIMMKMKMLTKR